MYKQDVSHESRIKHLLHKFRILNCMIDRIPRDVRIEIVKIAGMDARIALGIVGRLRVPQRVVDAINAIRRPTDYGILSRVDLGVYQLQYTKGHMSPVAVGGLAREIWHVIVYKRPLAFSVLEIQSIDVSYDRTVWTTDA